MSADNGIYVLQCQDGFRVAHCQAIENMYWWNTPSGLPEKRSTINPEVIHDYFKDSFIYTTRPDALKEAKRIYNEIMTDINNPNPVVEYGICILEVFKNEEFPTGQILEESN